MIGPNDSSCITCIWWLTSARTVGSKKKPFPGMRFPPINKRAPNPKKSHSYLGWQPHYKGNEGTLGHGVLDLVFEEVQLLGLNEGSDVCIRLRGVTNAKSLHYGQELLNELFIDTMMDIYPFD